MTSTDKSAFRDKLLEATHITVLTGAGVSAESGIPTFRGQGGLWKEFSAQELANPRAWKRDPGLVWEFYNYRRQIMADKKPNPAHFALARLEEYCQKEGKDFHLITQNIDDLHFDAGSKAVIRLHGSLWLVRCLKCGHVEKNRSVPITPAYEGSGSPDAEAERGKFGAQDLPRCSKEDCDGIVRPHVVWFEESLNPKDITRASEASQQCDFFLVVGTSAVVHPAAGLVPLAKSGGAVVTEINLEATPASSSCDFVFQGKAGELLPQLFDF